jgi:hypothetical protein
VLAEGTVADQAELLGGVASDSTWWRLLDRLDGRGLGAVTIPPTQSALGEGHRRAGVLRLAMSRTHR